LNNEEDDLKEQYKNMDEFALKRLEGARIAEKFYNVMRSEKLTLDDFLWIYSFFGDYRMYEALPDKQGNRIAQGLDTLLEIKNAESFTPQGIETYLSNVENISKLKERFLFAWHKKLSSTEFDPIIKGAILAFSKRNYIPHEYFSDKFWLQWVYGGSSGVLTGNKGSGKTDFGLSICEIARRNGYKIVSNVRADDVEYEKGIFTTFSEMIEKVINNTLQNKRTLIFADEMTVSGMRRKQAMKGTSLNLDQFEKLTRKFLAATLYIWHMDTEIPSEIFKSINFEGHKNGDEGHQSLKTTGIFKFNQGFSWNTYLIKGIPKSELNFDTKDLAPFILDIKLEDIIKAAREAEEEIKDNDELLKAIRDYVIEQRVKNEKEK
jgi:hypothetical protein